MADSYSFNFNGQYSASMPPTASMYGLPGLTVQFWAKASSSDAGNMPFMEWTSDPLTASTALFYVWNPENDVITPIMYTDTGTLGGGVNVGAFDGWKLWTFVWDNHNEGSPTYANFFTYKNAALIGGGWSEAREGDVSADAGTGATTKFRIATTQFDSHAKFNGSIAQVRMWARAISASEITSMVSQSEITDAQKVGMVGYWKMDENSGSIFHSEIGGAAMDLQCMSDANWSPDVPPQFTGSPAPPPPSERDNYLENLLITKGLLPELAGEDSEVVNYYRRNAAITRKGKF